jgi:hypothetical protein
MALWPRKASACDLIANPDRRCGWRSRGVAALGSSETRASKVAAPEIGCFRLVEVEMSSLAVSPDARSDGSHPPPSEANCWAQRLGLLSRLDTGFSRGRTRFAALSISKTGMRISAGSPEKSALTLSRNGRSGATEGGSRKTLSRDSPSTLARRTATSMDGIRSPRSI